MRKAKLRAPPPPEDTATRALDRAFRLYEVLRAAQRGMTLAELSPALDTPKSSLLRLLRALVQRGHLRMEDGRYGLGPRHISLRRRYTLSA